MGGPGAMQTSGTTVLLQGSVHEVKVTAPSTVTACPVIMPPTPTPTTTGKHKKLPTSSDARSILNYEETVPPVGGGAAEKLGATLTMQDQDYEWTGEPGSVEFDLEGALRGSIEVGQRTREGNISPVATYGTGSDGSPSKPKDERRDDEVTHHVRTRSPSITREQMSQPIAPGQLQQLQPNSLAQGGLRGQQPGSTPTVDTHQQGQVPTTSGDLSRVTNARLAAFQVPVEMQGRLNSAERGGPTSTRASSPRATGSAGECFGLGVLSFPSDANPSQPFAGSLPGMQVILAPMHDGLNEEMQIGELNLLIKFLSALGAMPKIEKGDSPGRGERLQLWRVAMETQLKTTCPTVVQWWRWCNDLADEHYRDWIKAPLLKR